MGLHEVMELYNDLAKDDELTRLKDEVVEAAKSWHMPAADDPWAASRLCEALDRLVEFEGRHK